MLHLACERFWFNMVCEGISPSLSDSVTEDLFEFFKPRVDDFIKTNQSMNVIVCGNPSCDQQYFGKDGLLHLMVKRIFELLEQSAEVCIQGDAS